MDLVTLDMPDSDKAVPNAFKALKKGGHIFGYLPHIEQIKKFLRAMKGGFVDINTYEIIARDIISKERGHKAIDKGSLAHRLPSFR